MFKLILSLFVLLLASNSFSQIVINDDAFIVIDNGARVVVDNTNSNAIQTTGLGGNIISEEEDDKIIWLVGANAPTMTIPYTTTPVIQGGNGVKIPLTINLTASGLGNGHIELSTYETATDANTVFPSYVTNMLTPLQVVDRFWIIDNQLFTTNPAAILDFGYDDSPNEIAGTNLITEANLQAQRFSVPANDWQMLLYGTADVLNNSVNGVVVAPADFHEAWTLVDNIAPLPVLDLDFTAIKQGRNALLEWSTSAEINSDHYDVMRSLDGVSWVKIGEVQAAGNTQTTTSYSFVDESPFNGVNYYRLLQVDIDGEFELSDIRAVSFNNVESIVYPNPFINQVFIDAAGEDYSVEVLDPMGRLLLQDRNINQIDFSYFSASFYMIRIAFDDGRVELFKVVQQN